MLLVQYVSIGCCPLFWFKASLAFPETICWSVSLTGFCWKSPSYALYVWVCRSRHAWYLLLAFHAKTVNTILARYPTKSFYHGGHQVPSGPEIWGEIHQCPWCHAAWSWKWEVPSAKTYCQFLCAVCVWCQNSKKWLSHCQPSVAGFADFEKWSWQQAWHGGWRWAREAEPLWTACCA